MGCSVERVERGWSCEKAVRMEDGVARVGLWGQRKRSETTVEATAKPLSAGYEQGCWSGSSTAGFPSEPGSEVQCSDFRKEERRRGCG